MLRKPIQPASEFKELEAYCTGFQSPADDYVEPRLNIATRLVRDPLNTYYFESETDEMSLFDIRKGTLLVVDRSVKPRGGMLVIVWWDGEWITRQLIVHPGKQYLSTGREKDRPIDISEENIVIWGVVTWVCSNKTDFK